jgi:hypothetical protein
MGLVMGTAVDAWVDRCTAVGIALRNLCNVTIAQVNIYAKIKYVPNQEYKVRTIYADTTGEARQKGAIKV